MCVIYCSVAVLMCHFCTDRGVGVIQERVRQANYRVCDTGA